MSQISEQEVQALLNQAIQACGQAGQEAPRKPRLYYDQKVLKTAFYCNWCATLPTVPHRPWCPDKNEIFEWLMNTPEKPGKPGIMHPGPG